jgi:hypothetical protein
VRHINVTAARDFPGRETFSTPSPWHAFKYEKQQQDDQQNADDAARSIAPVAAMAPSGQATQQQQNQNDEQKKSHDFLLCVGVTGTRSWWEFHPASPEPIATTGSRFRRTGGDGIEILRDPVAGVCRRWSSAFNAESFRNKHANRFSASIAANMCLL